MFGPPRQGGLLSSTRFILVSLPSLLGLLAPPAGALAQSDRALTKPERKAMDIRTAEAATTDDVTLVEIGFKGNLGEELGTGGLKKARVTIELVPESGPTTTIVERGPSRKPKESRSGTQGRFDSNREGRTLLVLVEKLPVRTDRLVVTTSGPRSARASAARGGLGGGGLGGGVLDSVEVIIEKHLNTLDKVNQQVDTAQGQLHEAEQEDAKLERDEDRLHHLVQRAKRRLNRAETRAEAKHARMQLGDAEGELADKRLERSQNWGSVKTLRRWIDLLQKRRAALTPQCSDGVDNGDPEDSLADHPADPGCTGPTDVDEKHSTVGLNCPLDGMSLSHTVDLFTPATNSIAGARLTNAAGETIAFPQGLGPEGPTAGMSLCPGATTEWSYGAGPNAPPGGFPFNPPPGDTGARFVTIFDNPSGGSGAGGSVDVTMALDTRVP